MKTQNAYYFASFNDPRIEKTENMLDEQGVKFMTSSSTGTDYAIYTETHPKYKQRHG